MKQKIHWQIKVNPEFRNNELFAYQRIWKYPKLANYNDKYQEERTETEETRNE